MCPGDAGGSAKKHRGGDRGSDLGTALASEVKDLFENAKDLPVATSSGTTESDVYTTVRLRFEGAAGMTSLAEATVRGIPPTAFKGFVVDFKSLMDADPAIRSFDIVESSSDDDADDDDDDDDDDDADKSGFRREGVKLIINLPFPLSNRVMVHWKYLSLGHNSNPDEHLLILSERENDDLLEKVLTDHDKRKHVLGKTYLSAYWIQPLRGGGGGDAGDIAGTTIRYVFRGDMGGSIPKKIQEWSAPQNMQRSIQTIVGYGQRSHRGGAASN